VRNRCAIGVHFDGSVAGGHLHIDIDLDDFARLWRGDASQRGKHRLFKGLGNVEQSGGPLAAYRSAQCRSQAVGRGSCNSMSRSNIRPVCDLRSAADSGSGYPGMSTPLSQGSSSASVPQRQKLVAGSRAAGLLCAEHHEPVFTRRRVSTPCSVDHRRRSIEASAEAGRCVLRRSNSVAFHLRNLFPGRASPHAASSPHLLSADSPQPIPSLADAAARPQAGSA
jgi:hypothetical protein